MREVARTFAAALVASTALACQQGPPPTWNEHVASIVHENCASCHRPEGIAPFSALEYEEAVAHVGRIAEMVEAGAMPPWPPRTEGVHFLNERTLTEEERDLLVRWAEAGGPRGGGEAPPPPEFDTGWELGPPDLVVRPSEPIVLAAGKEDVFRNLVIPTGLDSVRYVRTVDLRPGSARNVHHAILNVDETGAARRADSAASGPGFPGMDIGSARPPEGTFVGWTPGKVPFPGREGMGWKLEPGTDLVLQLHMMPSDEPRTIQPEIGLYFSEGPPMRTPVVVKLWGRNLDIPAGESEYRVEDRFRLPVTVEVLSVYPHAHYLGKDLHGYAILPDGEERDLIHIPDWNFMWQDQYIYAEPVILPAGSEIVMEYVYDNSADNPRNPSDPPRRVRSGNRSTDEMAELIVQMVARREADRWALIEARAKHALAKGDDGWRERFNLALVAEQRGDVRTAVSEYSRVLEANPDLYAAHHNLGNLLVAARRLELAETHYREAARIEPGRAEARHNLGHVRELSGRPEEALEEYQRALELDSGYAPAHHAIGNLRFAGGDMEGAIRAYREAIRLDPDFADARVNLGNALRRTGRVEEAVEQYRVALRKLPHHLYANYNLATALQASGDLGGAVESMERAVRSSPNLYQARLELARLYRAANRRDAAIREYREAVRLAGRDSEAAHELAAMTP